MQHEASRRNKARRLEQNNMARQQTRKGLRPPRGAARNDVIITCANVTNSGPWEDEMRHGEVLGRADFIGIQEHRLGGEKLEIVAGECMRAGWDIVLDPAYTKDTQLGGGTAALAKDALGIRVWKGGDQSSQLRADLLHGRFTSGVIDLLGGAFLGFFLRPIG